MTDSIAFHAVSPDGAQAVVMLLERGDAGRVRHTEWPLAGFALPGVSGESTAAEVQARVEGWRRDGWHFSESPYRILDWLRPSLS